MLMKKILLSFFFMALPLLASAQLKFGYFSYQAAFSSMPGYAIAKKNLSTLSGQYNDEMRRAEEEFNKKYEEFLDGQSELAPSILQKRQSELQELMNRNLAFKEEAQRLLKQAEEEAYAPLRQKLADTLKRIGKEQGYALILNTDNDACPYIDPEQGEDITPLIKASF
jgi:outer membrane protein